MLRCECVILPADVDLAWRKYERRRTLFWIGFLGVLPWMLAFARWPRSALVVFGLIGWVLALVLCGMYLAFCPCPRCGKPFHMKGWYSDPFTFKCLNCGLERWEDPAHRA